VLGAGILEQVVGEVHKNVLKTMLCSYFTKNNRLSLYLPILFSTFCYNVKESTHCQHVPLIQYLVPKTLAHFQSNKVDYSKVIKTIE